MDLQKEHEYQFLFLDFCKTELINMQTILSYEQGF